MLSQRRSAQDMVFANSIYLNVLYWIPVYKNGYMRDVILFRWMRKGLLKSTILRMRFVYNPNKPFLITPLVNEPVGWNERTFLYIGIKHIEKITGCRE